jgi:drug/metabolite transporter (DMT)-like permease
MPRWWRRLTIPRRLLLLGLVVCLLGELGALIWDWPWPPFVLVGAVLIVINFVLVSRDGLRSARTPPE